MDMKGEIRWNCDTFICMICSLLKIFIFTGNVISLLNSHLSPKRLFNETPLTMIQNAFYFILKALFALKIFKVLSWPCGHAEKKAWSERFYEITIWLTKNHNAHIKLFFYMTKNSRQNCKYLENQKSF